MPRFFSAVARASDAVPRAVDVQAIGLAQQLAESKLDWDSVRAAKWYVDHPYEIETGGRYGLGFAARTMLMVNPTGLAEWIARSSGNQALVAVLRAGADQLWESSDLAARQLLSTGNAMLTAMAAAFLSLPSDEHTPPRPYKTVYYALVEGNIKPGDAIWLSGLQLKELVHKRYRLRGRLNEQSARSDLLRTHPERALGGGQHAAQEIESVNRELLFLTEGEERCAMELERVLNEMAQCWPEAGLDSAQMHALDRTFVDTPEIRYRLAEKLPNSCSNRPDLLNQNINQFSSEIGLKTDIERVFDQPFNIDRAHFFAVVPWHARSLIGLYKLDAKGPGHRTGQLIARLAMPALTFLNEPFIAARQSSRWESAAARCIAADLLALAVVRETPIDRRAEVDVLRQHATDHALKLLRLVGNRLTGRHLTDELARVAISYVNEERLTDWATADDLPAHMRAFAIWTNPTVAMANLALARTLFLHAAKLPTRERAAAQHFNQLLSLLDSAMTAATRAGDYKPLDELEQLWEMAAPNWAPHFDGRWSDAAGIIARALRIPGRDRDFILSDRSFANSQSRAWLEEQERVERT